MKIAQIAPPWIPVPPRNYGGTEAIIAYLVEEQIAQGHDVTLFAPGDARTPARHIAFYPSSLTEEGVPWPAHLKAFYHLYEAMQLIKGADFDIVHTHLSSAADMYLFPLMQGLRTPLVTTLHSRFPFDRVDSWVGDADQLYLKWLAPVPVVTVSESARANVPYALNFVGVVHLGIPTEHYCPNGKEREHFFVWLGRFVPEKGPHIAIEAAKRAQVPLVLAGTVAKDLRESREYFERVIEPQLDGERVKYIGPVNMEQKIDLLSRAHAFLNPIEWEEPGAVAIIETMALGCPIISFARGVAPELIIHGQTGFLVHNLDEMVMYMSRIHEIDREAACRHVQQNLSARAMSEKYVEIYRKVIEQRQDIVGEQPGTGEKESDLDEGIVVG
ncbi:MAG: glycosyltransferase family 4 protein [Ktedonobacteraceae bacterium]|nr:glycosyltransferase family 4 protein [Ktedonobacteraceae bacterium]